jgi:hypothetical protein
VCAVCAAHTVQTAHTDLKAASPTRGGLFHF